jgi:hypothetical protein
VKSLGSDRLKKIYFQKLVEVIAQTKELTSEEKASEVWEKLVEAIIDEIRDDFFRLSTYDKGPLN